MPLIDLWTALLLVRIAILLSRLNLLVLRSRGRRRLLLVSIGVVADNDSLGSFEKLVVVWRG